MTQYAEVVYETGNVSVMSFENKDELLGALKEHHRRAVSGESANDLGLYPAERVKGVYVYNQHPGEYNPDSTVTADEVQAHIKDFVKGKDVVNLNEVAAFVRDLTYPFKDDPARQDSKFKLAEVEVLTSGWE